MSSIKDYIIKEKAAIEDVTPKAEIKSEKIEFKIVLQNNTDFVINKKSSKIDKDLVFIVSQAQFYIKNNKNNKIEPLTTKKFNNFLVGGKTVTEKLSQVTWFIDSKKSYSFNDIIESIITKKNISELLKYEIKFSDYHDLHRKAQDCQLDPKLYKLCHDKYHSNNKQRNLHSSGSFTSFFRIANEIKENINYNNAIYFIDSFCDSGVYLEVNDRCGASKQSEILSVINKHNLDINRFIEYLSRDLYTQGIEIVNDAIIQIYADYLSMQQSLYGKIKEKYPKSLKTSHDKLSLTVSLVQRHKGSLSLFSINQKHVKLELKGDKYSIILPKESIEIVQEGINLNHCSAEYIDRVIKGNTLLVFLRLTEELDTPLITIEIKNNMVNQVSGYSNRTPTIEEDEFIYEWTKLNNIEYNRKYKD